MTDLKEVEKYFEKLPRPKIWFLCLQKHPPMLDAAEEHFVYEIQERETQHDHYRFYRADARLLFKRHQSGITLNLQQFDHFQNAIQVVVDTKNSTAMFGPTSQIGMSEPGIGLGSTLMSQVIKWLKTQYPDVEILAGRLSVAQAGEDNKDRRNKFYETQGFDVEYVDPDHKSGIFKKRNADELSNKPIKGHRYSEDYIFTLYEKAYKIMNEKERKIKLLEDDINKKKLVIRITLCFIIILL
ncbi:MAG: hypothetical protein ABF665_04280, partial [Gluconacetobacter sp.]